MTAVERFAPAMGSTAHVLVVGGREGLADGALLRIADLEQRWSRFLPDSEVSRHNAAIADGTTPPRPSADTQLLFDRAADGRRVTGGRFDADCLAAVAASGYDRSLGSDAPPAAPIVGFDPGGIGKGLAADIVTAELLAAGAAGALVSIGGDLRVRGTAPDGGPWRIDIEDPRDGGVLATVALDDGAVATSSQCKRRWTTADGVERHHLVDPRTATSSDSPVLAATVVAAEGWQAEVLAKVAFLDALGDHALAHDAGFGLVESLGAAALVVTHDLVVPTSRWHDFELRKAGIS